MLEEKAPLVLEEKVGLLHQSCLIHSPPPATLNHMEQLLSAPLGAVPDLALVGQAVMLVLFIPRVPQMCFMARL